MARLRVWIVIALALSVLLGNLLRAQVTDEEKRKREEFLKARGDTSPSPDATPKKKSKSGKKSRKTPSPKPKSSPEESSTPKPKKAPEPKAKKATLREDETSEATTSATPSAAPKKSPSPKPKSGKKKSGLKKETAKTTHKGKGKTKTKAKAKATPEPEKTPRPKASPSPETRTPPAPRAVAVPPPISPPTPRPGATPAGESAAQLTIEKSGYEQSNELAPPPSPPPRKFGFWPWSRPRTTNYRYLSRSVIEEIRRAPVASNRWKFIVVHNSGTRQGNARVFDYYHRRVRRMQNGLAYHFVIGNGTSTGNGQIEVGDRWRRQINGGHVHSDFLNNIALGICLVGDFNRDQPTRAQLDSCEELIRYLRQRCGKADGRNIPVRPHREMNPPRWATDCPGDAFPYSWFRRF